eukprot:TRINITY_DN76648_c0_g1_i1.p1 TRINITY_DN76648_c0_g1~~TRINITY_DN76648_c0_g1_i1.p1  ORF type:complete len:432 (-),score=80.68 TRINITY_DN76648_c0_g1_i1:232-1527(-)
MATFIRFDGKNSVCYTPDPLATYGSTWVQKGSAFSEDESQEESESGSRTPSRHATVIIQALQEKLESLKAEKNANCFEEKCFEDVVIGPPPGRVANWFEGDVMKVGISSNLTEPDSAAYPYKDCHATTSAQQLMIDRGVLQGSVGRPFSCAQTCKDVKRKCGCKEGATCPHCQHCCWSTAHADMQPKPELRKVAGPEADDAQLEEAKILANKLVSLLGGEEPFVSKPKETKVVGTELFMGTAGHPHSCAAACKYDVRRKGGCMYGEACLNCQDCLWSREAKDCTSGASFSGVVQDVQDREIGEGSSRADFGAFGGLVQDLQLSIVSAPLVMRLNEFLTVPPVLSTNPCHGQSRGELPAPQASPNGLVSLHASLGSVGHPHTCAPACKYAMRSKGCKDGPLCSHCHFCRWLRHHAKKSGSKQATETICRMSF